MLTLFSADDHIIEHPRVWTDRLPARYRDVAPRVVKDGGKDRWLLEDRPGPSVDELSTAKISLRDKTRANEPRIDYPHTYEEMLPGCYDSAARTRDLFENGVVASVCFPSVPRFGGTSFLAFDDKDLADLCVQAYNDFILDEWCPGGPPGLFVPMTLCQLWDPETAAKEISRCVDRGIRAISIPENMVHFGLPSFYGDFWDPIWRVCEEADIAVCMHLATAGNFDAFTPSPDAPRAVFVTVAGGSMSQAALLNLIFSPVCTKFPRLKVVFSESGIGWLPFALGRAELVWERYQGTEELPTERPMEIWNRNMYVCQVEEHVGLHFLDHIGEDKVLWELDYPHPDTVWPYAQQHTEEVFAAAGVSPQAADKITHLNSEKVFRWTPAELPKRLDDLAPATSAMDVSVAEPDEAGAIKKPAKLWV